MSNIEEHQKGEQNLSQDEFGERDQSKGQMKHVVASNPEEREIENVPTMKPVQDMKPNDKSRK